MKAYIVIEWNGETHEDSRSYPVAVYLDLDKAMKAAKEFNDSRSIEPIPVPREQFVPTEYAENYEEYTSDLRNEWEFFEQQKRQHIQEIEITE